MYKGVPQCSVRFCLYVQLIGDIMCKHYLKYDHCADDLQLCHLNVQLKTFRFKTAFSLEKNKFIISEHF